MGWIRIDRKLLDEPYYFGDHFDRTRCWIDLLLIAEFKPRTFVKRGMEVNVKRGQVAISLKELAARWSLSINTVRARLTAMQQDGRITMQKSNLVTIITICKYDAYQQPTPTYTQPTITPRAYEEVNPDTAKQSLQHDQSWQEIMCMRHHIPPAQLITMLDDFFIDASCRGITHCDITDVKQHFNNWLLIKLQKDKLNNEREKTHSRRRGFDVTATSAEEYKTAF